MSSIVQPLGNLSVDPNLAKGMMRFDSELDINLNAEFKCMIRV